MFSGDPRCIQTAAPIDPYLPDLQVLPPLWSCKIKMFLTYFNSNKNNLDSVELPISFTIGTSPQFSSCNTIFSQMLGQQWFCPANYVHFVTAISYFRTKTWIACYTRSARFSARCWIKFIDSQWITIVNAHKLKTEQAYTKSIEYQILVSIDIVEIWYWTSAH